MRLVILALTALLVWTGKAGDSISVQFQNGDASPALEWHAQMKLPLANTAAEYKVEWSADLKNWEMLAQGIRGSVGVSGEILRHTVSRPPANAFYRVSASVVPTDEPSADSIYGYASEFYSKLNAIGEISLDQFVAMYMPTNEFRTAVSFDVSTALFWNDFNTDPAVYNATNTTNDKRLTDFRFTPEEFSIFKTNGFVVSPRLGSYSFADAFYKVYIDDLPVYVSSDALLHAWHRTYVSILSEVEESFLVARFGLLLTNMIAQVPALHAQAVGTPLETGVLDADFYLAVARSLLTATNDPGQLNQAERINAALAAINEGVAREFPLFGAIRFVDFSQFKVRGHYANSPNLQKYFKAMMWAGIIDFKFRNEHAQSVREFSGAVALTLLLDRSNSREKWTQYDQTIRAFVGLPDCMTYAQLSDMLEASNFDAPFDRLNEVYQQFWAGDLGVQQIKSGYFYSPWGPERYKMPRSFAMMPQRFILDSWAFTKVVFDDIFVNNIKIQRRIPSGLDIAFSVFGNDQTVPEIAARIGNPNGRLWRDGRPYQHNLAAARECIDDHDDAFWGQNMYTSWLDCLRELSSPMTDANFPQALQTWAWAMSSLNSQLASWTQLRHDTVLYAKQSSTAMTLCGYPDAYVEPRPEFWRRLGGMTAKARSLLADLPEEGGKTISLYEGGPQMFYPADRLKANWLTYCDRFVQAAGMLESVARKQLAHSELSGEEISFLQDIVEQQSAYVMSGSRTYAGWYPRLFYKPLEHDLPYGKGEGSDLFDALVTDVHTNAKDLEGSGDPGCILHEAVGSVNMAFLAVDCGMERLVMYAGPVLSHYEFEQPIDKRLTDAEWKAMLKDGTQPAPPTWTKPFLAPNTYAAPPDVFWSW